MIILLEFTLVVAGWTSSDGISHKFVLLILVQIVLKTITIFHSFKDVQILDVDGG